MMTMAAAPVQVVHQMQIHQSVRQPRAPVRRHRVPLHAGPATPTRGSSSRVLGSYKPGGSLHSTTIILFWVLVAGVMDCSRHRVDAGGHGTVIRSSVRLGVAAGQWSWSSFGM
uniref:Uncharacterized protein n=1 Tax=Arundo donax TaxID=35708 RepID=A0A0A9GP89_ARUDO